MDVFFDARFDQITTTLKDNKIFDTNVDIAIFAASIGWEESDFKIDKKNASAPERIFYSNHKEGIVYLLALLKKGDANCLRPENDNECWKIFENAANAGLAIMDGWLVDKIGQSPIDVILSKMLEKSIEIRAKTTEPEDTTEDESINLI